MEGLWKWTYEDRLMTLKQIVSESRHKDPSAAVAAITEYNRMMEAAARNPDLLLASVQAGTAPSLPNVFTPKTLAKRWGCSERHIRRLVEIGHLAGFLLGGKLLRIKPTDVVEYEARPFCEAATEAAKAQEPEGKRKRKPADRLDPLTRARLEAIKRQGTGHVQSLQRDDQP